MDTNEDSISSDSVLEIVDFDPEHDSSTYTCTGTNAAGSTSVSLNVQKLGMISKALNDKLTCILQTLLHGVFLALLQNHINQTGKVKSVGNVAISVCA